MLWQIHSFLACTHHVFLSHCREDRRTLVLPLDKALREVGVIPWLDLHDYPHGRSSFAALRDGILQSRHTVFLVTSRMLAQPRGWTTIELAWTALLQENFQEPGGVLQNVMLPLFFLSPAEKALPRSVWQTVRDRAVFQPKRGDRVNWAVRQSRAFLEREAIQGLNVAAALDQDSHFRSRLASRPGLIDRVSARHPTPAPPPN